MAVSAIVEQPSASSGIRFDDVTVAYRRQVVLNSFSLDVEAGEVMALLGPSGSGKTTALRCVAGFVRPAAGRVHLGDRDVTDLPPYKRGIGMVVQQYALFPHMRVEQNVAFGLQVRRVPRDHLRARVRQALDMVGMGGYAKRYARELSGGQQQRVAIARALAIRPEVLLLDEPLSALDAQLRAGMLVELARLHRELPDITILYVTHDQTEALTLADRIAVMNDARLVDVGTATQLYQRPRSEFTAGFVGSANLLPVTVESCDEGSGHATVAFGGTRLRASVARPAAAGTERTLCIHPHNLSLAAEDGFDNCLRGIVSEVQWRGPSHRVFLDVDGVEVRVDSGYLRRPPERGSAVAVHFAPSDAVLLGAEGDER
ncbi:ABC transporter ATP-binding protein [Streptomyces sp. NPDC020800]|uniref:ABC transporter ATP-binding protein n=1 Tax=Streptomyces sp. NPDC020800 TaxID=3365092 RepID=UPI0037B8B464